MLDESGSVNSNNWQKEEQFTKVIAKMANIKPDGGRASVITFAGNAHLDIKFKAYQNYNSFARAVDNLRQSRGGTNIIRALNKGLSDMFQVRNGMRPESEKIAVLITDGQDSNGIKMYTQVAQKYRQRNIKLIVVGVGSVDRTKLKKLVQRPEDLFVSRSFDDLLKSFVQGVAENVQGSCKGINCKNFCLQLNFDINK